MLAWTGLRVSEALALRCEDIDFDGREIQVRFQLDDKGNSKRPKTKAGQRRVPLLPVLEQALRAQRQAQLAVGYAGSDQLIFTTATGKPLNRHNVRNQGADEFDKAQHKDDLFARIERAGFGSV